MTNLVVCIACLGTNVKMVPLINPIHRELFVKLADFKQTVGVTTDNMLCYICFSQLQRCYRFMSMSRKAQGILQQLRHYGTQLSQCTVSAMKEKPTFVISAIKSFDKILSEETVKSFPSAHDIKPIIITPISQIKEELLEITDVEEEEPVTMKEEPADNDVEFSTEKQQPHENKSKVDSKVTHLINQLKSSIQAHIDNSKMGNGIHPLLAQKTSPKVKENSLLVALKKRKYIKKKLKVKKMFVCNDCGKTFTCRGYLKRHLRVHTGEKPYTCEVCNKKFAQLSHLKQHMRQHTGEKPYTCHICKKKSFNHQYNYKKHMRKHFGDKSHKCELCIAKFYEKSDLQRHILTHTGEKPFSCDFCEIKFRQKSSMTKHIKDFHPGDKADKWAFTLIDKNNEHGQVTLPKKVIRQFNCTYAECLKIFQRKGALFNHINRIHLGVIPDKSYFCEKCDTKFTKKIQLKKHTCELKSEGSQKIEVSYEHQDLQKNGVENVDNLQKDLSNLNEDKIFYPPNNEEEYIIP